MNKLNVKQFKKRFIRGLVEPELFYLPVKKTEREPMVIKILVNNINNNLLVIPLTKSIYCFIKAFKYSNMEQEYEEAGKITVNASNYYINLTPYYNLKIKDESRVLVTDDIDYFRNPNYDCLYKKPNENITNVIYSKCASSDPLWCEIDWGDGTVDYCDNISEHLENDVFSYDRVNNENYARKHSYTKTGEYYITIKGNIPSIDFSCNRFDNGISYTNPFDNPNIQLLEVCNWGELGVYNINSIFGNFYRFNNDAHKYSYKMPKHISPNSFKNVLTASQAFAYLDMDEDEFSHEIMFDFVKTFPNLLNADYMLGETKISYIPEKFCYNHKNILNCGNMFFDCPITKIGAFAFANCDNLSTVNDLTYSSNQPFITMVEDSIFENDTNLLDIFGAFNYINNSYIDSTYLNDEIGLKTVGNNIYKNCKRLRHANEPFYQQAGLVTVGDSLFEGCEDLISVGYCFYNCYSLERIGANIFKGCTKVRECVCFCCGCYFVNYPDKMFYDLKYYNYLKNFNTESFNGYWESVSEDNGIIRDNVSELSDFLKYKGYNHENFPTRKHSNDIFSKSFVQESIDNNSFLSIRYGNNIFDSSITFRNKISDICDEYVHISNFTGKAFPIWEYKSYLQSLRNNAELFGFRNIKVKRTKYKKSDTGVEYEKTYEEYDTTINHYDNYMDIATADPFYYEKYQDGYGGRYWAKDKLLHTYYYPDEYETETEKQEVLEFNDPVEERKYGT